ncbi:MAG: DHHA1 domain-containing protein [Dehalococcoidales bacterium]|nr:DHHA1 domain-containing protein [Dehalococcoidales bacterium]
MTPEQGGESPPRIPAKAVDIPNSRQGVLKMKCFYHNDMDGKCAGAIVYKFYKRDRDFTKATGEECEFISIDYKDDFPFSRIKPGETVVIVDFSLQKPGEFEKLLQITDNLVWIDHHKTAIERHGDLDIAGIRKDGVAGCVLTWDYFYPDGIMPFIVDLIGDYDIWKFKFGDDTRNLQAGIRLYETRPGDDNWINWLNSASSIRSLIKDGEIAVLYRTNYYKDLIKSLAFFTEFEGHKAVACNAGLVNSQLFDSVQEDYDLMLPFYFDGKQWTVSIYTTKDIDCSEIAKKYGGGGHKQAAGFQCKELPFVQAI